MMLLLQVLFLQGHLWADRFPGRLATMGAGVPNWWCLLTAGAVIFAATQAAQDSLVVGILGASLGLALLLSYSPPFLARLGMALTTTITLSWQGASLAVLLQAPLLIAAIYASDWLFVFIALVLILTVGAAILRAIETHYLLFRDPKFNGDIIRGGNQLTLLSDAYLRLPAMILGLRPVDGGRTE